MLHRFRNLIVAPALALGVVGFAGHADAASYVLGDGSYVGANDDWGLTIETYVYDLDGLSFNLDDGESYTFDFFGIWTNESEVNWDDEHSQDITAYLEFDTPDQWVVVDGETDGKEYWSWDWCAKIQKGVVEWDGCTIIESDCLKYKIELSDATFNKGKWDLNGCWWNGAIVQATVTQIGSGPCVVPTPSAAGAGLALMGLGLLRRRRAAA